MKWKEAAAQLGTSTLLGSLKALQGTMKKREYKRLVATTVAQLLALHPGVGAKKARRWARRATGTKPAKQELRGTKPREVVEGVGAAAVAAGAAKVVGRVAKQVGDQLAGDDRKRAQEGRVHA